MDRAAFLEIFPLQGSVTLPTKSLQEIVTSVATKVRVFFKLFLIILRDTSIRPGRNVQLSVSHFKFV